MNFKQQITPLSSEEKTLLHEIAELLKGKALMEDQVNYARRLFNNPESSLKLPHFQD